MKIILSTLTFFLLHSAIMAQDTLSQQFYIFKLDVLEILQNNKSVSTGTRSVGRIMTETAAPVDVITQNDISRSPHIELSRLLTFILPYFNANHQTIADGTDHIDPASMRGLGPDQVLVLINGKRRHNSSLVNVNGSFGRGSCSIDFNTIPIAAIERIEILRDGASAQYGSDAIAGVINIILKQDETLSVSSHNGLTIEGDGQVNKHDINVGRKISERGFTNITLELLQRGSTDRSGKYTGKIYNSNETDSQDPRTINFNRDVMKVGDAQVFSACLFFNNSIPLRSKTDLYSFGGFSYRQGSAYGFYRFPYENKKVETTIYPNGFLPEINPEIYDKSLTLGLREQINEWYIDLSTTYSQNKFDFFVQNSNNASMGRHSPTRFFCGGYEFEQSVTNLNFSRSFKFSKFIERINIALGSEFRIEGYGINAGEEASYIDGGDTLSTGEKRQSGVQVFPGFQPENQLNRNRNNVSYFIDIETDVTQKLFVELAARYESYSDFGKRANWKASLRYKIFDRLTFRTTSSTGFRAPSLQQFFLTNTSTQFIDNKEYKVGTFNNDSPVTRAFGIGKLKEESSFSYTVGFTLKNSDNLLFTFDAYNLQIENRIVLSGRFDSNLNQEIGQLLAPCNANSAQFFTNAVDTRTQGFDVASSYNFILQTNRFFKIAINYNFSKTIVHGQIKVPPQLSGLQDVMFNKEEVSRLEWAIPQQKLILTTDFQTHKYALICRLIGFGKVKYVHKSNSALNQTFSEKLITELVVSVRLTDKIYLDFGGNNIFNIYPDKIEGEESTESGNFDYSRRVMQFGFNGAFYYFKLNYSI